MAGENGTGVMRWVAGAVCALGAAVVCLAASPASAAAGDLDGAFGTGGKVTTDFAGNGDEARAVALQPDGKIVAAGGALGATVDFALARYGPDGTLDPTFGAGGTVATDFGSGEQAYAVAVQPDGKIVAAGGAATGFELARYNADGSLDATFGAGGKVTTRFGLGLPFTRAHAIVLQPDGKIVVAGTATAATVGDFGLARYNPNGSLDASFGAGGKVTTDIGGTDSSDAAWAVALQPDGKLVVAGSTAGPSGDAFALARYTPTGALDSAFGSSGRVITGFGGDQDWAQAVAVQADGKIVAAGKTGNQCCGGTFNFALARYTAGGTLDTAFGGGGKVTTDFAGGADNAHALAIQADGKILAGGERLPGGNPTGASFDFALARYQPGGTLDPAFGAGGLVTTDFAGHNDHAYALALQQDGKVVAAGDSSPDFALTRYATAAGNNPPVAQDDSYSAAEDTPLTVPAPGVLGNDSDADGDPVSVAAASVTAPAHGTATVNADGSFTYTPAANFNGADTVTYQASDGAALSGTATVTVTVTAVNDPPTAAADQATVAENASTAIDVTANDTPGPANEAGQVLSVSSVGQPAHGQAAVITGGADAGQVRYTPAAGYAGPDAFAYTVCDDGQTNGLADPKCDTADVAVTVRPVADLALRLVDSPDPVLLGQTLAYTATVSNRGPSGASGVVLTDTLPASTSFASAAATQGSCSQTAGTVSCALGGLAASGTATITIQVTPRQTGTITDAAAVSANEDEPNPADNQAAEQTTVKAANARIAYVRGGDIFSMSPDGTNQIDLTQHPATDTDPYWSPDRSKIAFSSNRGNNYDIYVMNADGTAPTRLTTNAKADDQPAWSPDGKKIAFASSRDGNWEIYWMNADGTGQVRLTKNAAPDLAPDWSPDGQKIAFTRNSSIYVMNADGSGQKSLLVAGILYYSNPAWSPNGAKIAFDAVYQGDPRNGYGLGIMNADGTNLVGITSGMQPSWSPDGQKVVFASDRDSNCHTPVSRCANMEIYLSNPDGSEPTRLTTNTTNDVLPDW